VFGKNGIVKNGTRKNGTGKNDWADKMATKIIAQDTYYSRFQFAFEI
jgi:hypothetical protein